MLVLNRTLCFQCPHRRFEFYRLRWELSKVDCFLTGIDKTLAERLMGYYPGNTLRRVQGRRRCFPDINHCEVKECGDGQGVEVQGGCRTIGSSKAELNGAGGRRPIRTGLYETRIADGGEADLWPTPS